MGQAGREAFQGLWRSGKAPLLDHLAGTIQISLMRGSARAAGYAMAEITGSGYEHVERMPRAVRAVTNEEVIEVARRYLDPDGGFAKVVLRGEARPG